MKKVPNRIRKNRIEICFDDDELAFIERKMKRANIKHKSDYIRQMCLHGKVVAFDDLDFRYCLEELKKIGNNLNQIAKFANSTGNIYREDIQCLKQYFDIIHSTFSKNFSKINALIETVRNAEFYTMTEQIEQVVNKLKNEKILE